jgi:hypothetical protein
LRANIVNHDARGALSPQAGSTIVGPLISIPPSAVLVVTIITRQQPIKAFFR